jgi:hypothetical protein
MLSLEKKTEILMKLVEIDILDGTMEPIQLLVSNNWDNEYEMIFYVCHKIWMNSYENGTYQKRLEDKDFFREMDLTMKALWEHNDLLHCRLTDEFEDWLDEMVEEDPEYEGTWSYFLDKCCFYDDLVDDYYYEWMEGVESFSYKYLHQHSWEQFVKIEIYKNFKWGESQYECYWNDYENEERTEIREKRRQELLNQIENEDE